MCCKFEILFNTQNLIFFMNDFNPFTAIFDLERRITELDMFTKFLIDNNPNLRLPSAEQSKEFHRMTIQLLQQKYPDQDIRWVEK